MNNLIYAFLNKWLDKKTETEDCYQWEIDDIDFWDALDGFLKKQKENGIITHYDIINCGGFESCGYEIHCNALAIIDKNGNLLTYVLNQELR